MSDGLDNLIAVQFPDGIRKVPGEMYSDSARPLSALTRYKFRPVDQEGWRFEESVGGIWFAFQT